MARAKRTTTAAAVATVEPTVEQDVVETTEQAEGATMTEQDATFEATLQEEWTASVEADLPTAEQEEEMDPDGEEDDDAPTEPQPQVPVNLDDTEASANWIKGAAETPQAEVPEAERGPWLSGQTETPTPAAVPDPEAGVPQYRCGKCKTVFTKATSWDGGIRCPQCHQFGSEIDPKTGLSHTEVTQWLTLEMPTPIFDEMTDVMRALMDAGARPRTYSRKAMARDIWAAVWPAWKETLLAEAAAAPPKPAPAPKAPPVPKAPKQAPAPKAKAPKGDGKAILAQMHATAKAEREAATVQEQVAVARSNGSDHPAHDMLAEELGASTVKRGRPVKEMPQLEMPTTPEEWISAVSVEISADVAADVEALEGDARTAFGEGLLQAQALADQTSAIMLVYLKQGQYRSTKKPSASAGVLVAKVHPRHI